METITKKLNELSPSTTKSNKVAAYSEPPKDYQHKLDELTELMKRMEGHLLNQSTSVMEQLLLILSFKNRTNGKHLKLNLRGKTSPPAYTCCVSRLLFPLNFELTTLLDQC